MKSPLLIGTNPLRSNRNPVSGHPIHLEGQPFYQIANYDRMQPFFLSVVSSGDQWMFISSTGALTAGRRNPDVALFPYCTEDKIHDSAGITGSLTVLLVQQQNRTRLWEPFSSHHSGVYRTRRNLYKNTWGNQLIF